MSNCAVASCGNYYRKTKGSNIRYFRFPKNEDMSKQWLVACKREDVVNVKNAYICSVHFETSCFELPLRQRLLNYTTRSTRVLKPDAVPTLNNPGKHTPKNSDDSRSHRLSKRQRHREVNEILMNTNTYDNICSENNTAALSPVSPNNTNVDSQWPSTSQDVIVNLKDRISELERQNTELKRQLKEAEKVTAKKYENLLAKVFTPGQIRKLVHSKQEGQIRWTPEDIASAVSLRSVSPKVYRYLRARNYPLPALSTLRNWVTNFDVSRGLLKGVFNLMRKKSHDLKEMERICILSFDEIHISNNVEIDRKKEQKVGSHKTCQTVMVRGLVSNWKQPVYYQFDQPMTKPILETIIAELYNSRFVVVGMVSDMGTTNTKLWTDLNVGHNKNCFFNHPINSELKIFVYADVPHLLKLSRNHLIDHGFNIEGHIINVDYFQSLLHISTSELTLISKLTQSQLEVKGAMRQRVRPAAQLLSNSVAKALHYCGERGLMPKNSSWQQAGETVQLFNDWFDLMNSNSKIFGNCPSRNAFGTDIEYQTNLLQRMSALINKMRVGNHKNLIPFQKGILLSNRSLIEMHDYLKTAYKVEYILTARVNQDVLENFFSYIPGMGATNDHPSPLDFQHRLKWYIMGKHSEAIFTDNRNTRESNESCLLSILEDKCNSIPAGNTVSNDICITHKMLSNLTNNVEATDVPCEEETLTCSSFVQPEYLSADMSGDETMQIMESFEIKESINREALRYIAGYVAFKFKSKYTLGIPSSQSQLNTKHIPDWIDFISRGPLLQPCDELFNAALVLESEFFAMHGKSLSHETNIFQTLAERTASKIGTSKVPFEVLLLLSRTRTYIRLRDINRQISFKNCQKKLEKKISKFTNIKK